ncbi:MAG: FHA domain-containing protein [Bryobacterales bacterium]|nr:FHA domain-containing protein [Bryobacterales bacterium]
MAKKLNEDGVPVEIPSNVPRRTKSLFAGLRLDRPEKKRQSAGDVPTKVTGQDRIDRRFDDEPPTRPATILRGSTPDAGPQNMGEPRTVIAGGWRRDAAPQRKTDVGETGRGSDFMDDPVVGWLVVVDGPGTGASVQLGSGQNSLGRGAQARVRLNFGDPQISRATHATVTYDPKGNRFYIHQGTGANLTYLEGKPVLAPTPLPSGSEIVLGDTTLRFVALCDDGFNWTDRHPGEQ